MQHIKQHILFKLLSILLVFALLLPIAAKFAHIFANHEHDICKGEVHTHLHELNVECDIYKYKLTTNYTPTFFCYNLYAPLEYTGAIMSQYQFLSEFQRLQTSLRGPPVLTSSTFTENNHSVIT
ncbi:MAG: hypothetical protein ACK5MZ_10120 [Aestuariibaculum sp.]